MWVIFGLLLGFLVYTSMWAFVGPFVALLNFIIGRFFIASVLMAISLYSESILWDDFHVGREEYQVLLIMGLILEGIKWVVKQRLQPKQRFEELEEEFPNIVINIVDDEPEPRMKDITPRRKMLEWIGKELRRED
jgi:hypothetical protein